MRIIKKNLRIPPCNNDTLMPRIISQFNNMIFAVKIIIKLYKFIFITDNMSGSAAINQEIIFHIDIMRIIIHGTHTNFKYKAVFIIVVPRWLCCSIPCKFCSSFLSPTILCVVGRTTTINTIAINACSSTFVVFTII